MDYRVRRRVIGSFKHLNTGILLPCFLNCQTYLTVGETQFKGPTQVTQDALGPSCRPQVSARTSAANVAPRHGGNRKGHIFPHTLAISALMTDTRTS